MRDFSAVRIVKSSWAFSFVARIDVLEIEFLRFRSRDGRHITQPNETPLAVWWARQKKTRAQAKTFEMTSGQRKSAPFLTQCTRRYYVLKKGGAVDRAAV